MVAAKHHGLDAFVTARGAALLRVAVLLAGSHEAGEDLFQHGLERLVRHWSRIDGDPEGYFRRTLYGLAVDGWRRRRRRPERLEREPPARAVGDESAIVDLRDALTWALELLPPRQRAVIVLRHWEQLSEAETASAPSATSTAGPVDQSGRPQRLLE